jgi:hypothetical protein
VFIRLELLRTHYRVNRSAMLVGSEVTLPTNTPIHASALLRQLCCRTGEGDQRGGEWEPIKIPHWNSAYIPKSTRNPSLLTRPRPPSYRQAIGLRNQARKLRMVLARPGVRSMTKIDSKNSLYPLGHFTEHLVGVFGKTPCERNVN